MLKGPIPLSERVRKNWIREDGGVYRLRMEPDAPDRFATQHISYWNIFPDTTARSPETMESTIERHIMRERDLRDFARQPGVDRDQVRELVEEGPQEELPEFMLQLDTVTEEEQSSFQNKVFVMLEYRGPLESEEMQEIISEMIRIEGKNSQEDGDESEERDDEEDEISVEIDPLMQMDAVVYFCQAGRFGFRSRTWTTTSPCTSSSRLRRA